MDLSSALAGVAVHHHDRQARDRHAGLFQCVSGYGSRSKILQTASDLLGTLNDIRVS